MFTSSNGNRQTIIIPIFIHLILLLVLSNQPGCLAQDILKDCLPLNISESSHLLVNNSDTKSGTWIKATCVSPYVINGGADEFLCSDGIWRPTMPKCTSPSTGGNWNAQLTWALVGSILGGCCCVVVVALVVCLHLKSEKQKSKQQQQKGDSESKCDLDQSDDDDDDLRSVTKSNELRGIPDYFSIESSVTSSVTDLKEVNEMF